MHISQTWLTSQDVNSKKHPESLVLYISPKRPNTQHFFYCIIPHIVLTVCIIYVVRCQHTPNFSSSTSLIIARNEFNTVPN